MRALPISALLVFLAAATACSNRQTVCGNSPADGVQVCDYDTKNFKDSVAAEIYARTQSQNGRMVLLHYYDPVECLNSDDINNSLQTIMQKAGIPGMVVRLHIDKAQERLRQGMRGPVKALVMGFYDSDFAGTDPDPGVHQFDPNRPALRVGLDEYAHTLINAFIQGAHQSREHSDLMEQRLQRLIAQ